MPRFTKVLQACKRPIARSEIAAVAGVCLGSLDSRRCGTPADASSRSRTEAIGKLIVAGLRRVWRDLASQTLLGLTLMTTAAEGDMVLLNGPILVIMRPWRWQTPLLSERQGAGQFSFSKPVGSERCRNFAA